MMGHTIPAEWGARPLLVLDIDGVLIAAESSYCEVVTPALKDRRFRACDGCGSSDLGRQNGNKDEHQLQQ